MSSFGSILIAAFVLLLGFVLLIKGADAFVDGSSAVARRLRIPGLVIGLTIVAMGTSLPELAVSVTAALAGSNEIAVSNVTGSNIFNLMIVLGFSALFTPLAVSRKSLTREFPFSVACAVTLAIFGATGIAAANAGDAIGLISRTEGLILLFFFVLFLLYTLHEANQARRASLKEDKEDLMSLSKSLLLIVLGMLAIKFGGDFVVGGDTVVAGHELSYGAVALARVFGMTDTLIGLTICAVGTSLPELVTSIAAARKNQLDMAVGNVIGSNIFNILFILGTTATIHPVAFTGENLIDTVILLAFSALVWRFTWTKHTLVRKEGLLLITLYAIFLLYAVLRVYW